MKFLRSFLLFLATLILFLIAFNFAAPERWFGVNPVLRLVQRWIIRPDILARPLVQHSLWAAAGLLVVAIWVLTIGIWRKRPRAIQTRSAAGESVLIHPGALNKFVRLQVESHPAVVTHKERVRQKGSRGVSIWVAAEVQPLDSLPNIKRQIEDTIRNGFSQVLGIEKLDELTIILGLDEKTLNHRPGPVGTPEPKPEPPARVPLEEKPASEAPAKPAEKPPFEEESERYGALTLREPELPPAPDAPGTPGALGEDETEEK